MGTGATNPISKTETQDLSITGPREDSPFFIERQEAKAAAANAGRAGFGMYVPKPPHPPIRQQIKTFFSGMFGSLKSNKAKGTPPMALTVEPSDVSLSQCSELDVTLKISNGQRQMLELLYPDDQRLEILTKDSAGVVVNRWSEDRAFEPKEGFVAVDPAEFISYSEKIPTSAMKAGESYTIEVTLANQKDYSISATITPKP